jgi:hypothetical protein
MGRGEHDRLAIRQSVNANIQKTPNGGSQEEGKGRNQWEGKTFKHGEIYSAHVNVHTPDFLSNWMQHVCFFFIGELLSS